MSLFLFTFIHLTFAANSYFLKGEIGNNEFAMRLKKLDENLFDGEYWYLKTKKPISIQAEKTHSNDWSIKAFISDKSMPEQFNGNLEKGVWTYKNKKLRYSLKKFDSKSYWNLLCIKNAKDFYKLNSEYDTQASELLEVNLEDIDGDHQKETLIGDKNLFGVTGNRFFELYVSNNGCLTPAGRISGSIIKVLNVKNNGHKNISTFLKGGCAGKEGVYNELSFEGEEYVTVKKIECPCEIEKKRPKECP